MKFVKKPIAIDAIRPIDMTDDEVRDWLGRDGQNTEWVSNSRTREVTICTLEGNMKANAGDWVIRGVKGELYPCKPDIFEATYVPWRCFTCDLTSDDCECVPYGE